MGAKRFRIAFSFAGEKRELVAQVAAILAKRFGEKAILYDKYHESEFARPRLGRYLPKLYHDQADLVVVFICENYSQKEWPGLEWDAVFDLLKKRKEAEVMLCRFDHVAVDGLFDAGYIELKDKTADQIANLVLQRLAHNEDNPKGYYTAQIAAVPTAQVIAVHLHPDFRVELSGLLEVWNSNQARLAFTPFRPPTVIESFLLSETPIEGIVAQEIATQMRGLADFEEHVGIFQFCEGRLFGDDCDQLFSWTSFDNERFDSSTISLFIKRANQVRPGQCLTLLVNPSIHALRFRYCSRSSSA